jgi:ABC-type nitrate/sulfonate/bicarbonate transport system permease component
LRLPERALPWLSVAGVLVLFEALPRVGLLPEDHFPPMSLILGELASETTDSAFWSALGHTLEGWSLGLGIAALVAVPLGILALAYQPEMLLMDEPMNGDRGAQIVLSSATAGLMSPGPKDPILRSLGSQQESA